VSHSEAQRACAAFDIPHHQVAHERRTRIVVGVTAVAMVAELVAGWLTGSLALLADGWHMASHVGALGLVAAGYWLARRQAGHRWLAFGPGTVNALAGYTAAGLLVLAAAWLAFESIARLRFPRPIDAVDALPVAAVGLVANLVCARILEHEEGAHDHSLRAARLHVLADAFTSILAIVALVLVRYTGWVFLDPLVGLVGAAVVFRWGAGLLRDTAKQLLCAVPSPTLEDAIRRRLESLDDTRIVDFHFWEVGHGRRGLIVSLATSAPRPLCDYRAAIHAVGPLEHVTIEVEPCEH